MLVGVLHHSGRQAVPLNLAVSLTTIAVSLISRSSTLPSTTPLAPDLLSLAARQHRCGIRRSPLGQPLLRAANPAGDLAPPHGDRHRVDHRGVRTDRRVRLLPNDQVVRIFAGLLFGVGIGLFSSRLGVAGGEVIIPTLVFAFGADIKVAGTASLLVSLPTVLTGIARYARRGAYADREPMRWTVLPMSAGSVIGAVAGGLALGLVPAGLPTRPGTPRLPPPSS